MKMYNHSKISLLVVTGWLRGSTANLPVCYICTVCILRAKTLYAAVQHMVNGKLHAGTVVPECFNHNNAQVNGKGGNSTSLPQKPLNRSSPKFAWVIMSWTPTPVQNFIKIRLPSFVPPPKYTKMRVE